MIDGHPHDRPGRLGDRLNWLRAGVLGANDGIVSVAGVVVGVAGATSDRNQILTAGIAATVAGALSMSGGEYVSVSTQLDTEQAAIARETEELRTMPEEELMELARYYESRGVREETARQVAKELTQADALRAHAEMEFNLTPGELTSPWHAALASFVAFAIGALIPMVAIATMPGSIRVWVCVVSVAIALLITGYTSAALGDAPRFPAVVRNVVVGMLTMLVAWAVGRIFDVATN
jgi:VIT1/CCC1 family predicted Fe2+/Mn2+ transporter